MRETKNSKIKTAIIEHRRDLREDLIALFDSTPGFRCAGGYNSMKSALADFRRETPDIVLWNHNASRIKEVHALREKFPNLPVLILNIYEDGENNLFDSPNVAANNACLLKLSLPAKFLKSARRFLTKSVEVSPDLIGRLFGSPGDFRAFANTDYELTPHETRVLKLLTEGHNYTTAAECLKVSYNTIKFHMKRIYQKLEVNSKSAAVAKAIRHGLVN